jgi:two-component system, NtrC family, nitrogen regulation response regulator NtrX
MPYIVLIVDDDKKILASLSRSLTLAGYVVNSFENGEEAVTFCKTGHCDVVVMDVDLPGDDGLTTIEHIREIRPDIKVIVISGYYVEVGDIYIPKPVIGTQLIKTIKSLLIEQEKQGD